MLLIRKKIVNQSRSEESHNESTESSPAYNGGTALVAVLQMKLKKATFSKLRRLPFHFLIFQVFFQTRKPQGFIIFFFSFHFSFLCLSLLINEE